MNKKAEARIAPIALVIFLVIVWQICCVVFNVSEHLLPSPLAIAKAFKTDFFTALLPDAWTSIKIMLAGYLIAVPLGFVIAGLVSQSKFLTRMFLPILIILMMIPMATLVPEFKLFLGVKPSLKILVIILQCTPVIAVNSLSGFTHVPQNRKDLLMGYGCGKAELFFRVVVPNALPQIFTGLKLGCILCVIAEMSADMSVGQGGLGYRISRSATFNATSVAFAGIICAAVIGVLFYMLVNVIEGLVIRWKK